MSAPGVTKSTPHDTADLTHAMRAPIDTEIVGAIAVLARGYISQHRRLDQGSLQLSEYRIKVGVQPHDAPRPPL